MRRLLPLAAALFVAPAASAQFFERLVNPDVTVKLVHPPELGLKVQRVAFLPCTDPAGSELVALLTERLTGSELEVVDRANLQNILREQRLGAEGYLDPATVAQLGRLLGPSVLLNLQVHQCKATFTPLKARSEGKDKAGNLVRTTTYTSRTRLEFSASVQAVDLSTGRIFMARRLAFDPQMESVSTAGQPEFPPESAVRERAFGEVASAVRRMLLPWSETRRLIFYDDKDYGMKEAYRLLEGGDARAALARSEEARKAAQGDPAAKPKHRGRTAYNVGMCHFILGRLDEARPFLREARETDLENGIYREALGEVEKALQLREEMQRVDDRSRRAEPRPPAPPREEPRATGPAKPSLEERLERLGQLYRKGLITAEEFKARKAELLKEL